MEEDVQTKLTYQEALTWLNAPKYSATRPGLNPIRELMRRLGNPQDGLKYVHVAGTNGKGSTCAFLDSVLRAAGYRTGLYTSPFLEHFTERIRVDGEEIPEEDVACLTEKVREQAVAMAEDGWVEPTVFEMVTAVAFLYFRERGCDAVVLEVGMGGRLDATNLVRAEDKAISVIARLGMDHMQFLGDTLAEIAGEKAGIICDGTPVVSTAQEPEARAVLEEAARAHGVSILFTDDLPAPEVVSSSLDGQTFRIGDSDAGEPLTIRLLGTYQLSNAMTAYAAIRVLREEGWTISEEALRVGFAKTRWEGRFELVHKDPVVIIDGAHNPNGVESLVKSLKSVFPGEKFSFITGVLADKDYAQMVELVAPLAKRFLTVTPDCARALPSVKFADYLRKKTGVPVIDCGEPEKAAELSLREFSDDVICAFGSLYYIGEIRGLFE